MSDKSYGEIVDETIGKHKRMPSSYTEMRDDIARAVLLKFIGEVRSHPLWEVRPEQAFEAEASRIEQPERKEGT